MPSSCDNHQTVNSVALMQNHMSYHLLIPITIHLLNTITFLIIPHNFTFSLPPSCFLLCTENAEKVKHLKRRILDQQWFSSIASIFEMGTSLKGKNSLPEGANSFLYEQFLIVWKITFIILNDLPWMLLCLLRTCVTCVMGATPMTYQMLTAQTAHTHNTSKRVM